MQAPEEEQFDWARQWYPVAFVDDLDPTKPHSIELLGKRLVLWRDGKQQWRTFEDKCPHRLAPLSGTRLFEASPHFSREYHDKSLHSSMNTSICLECFIH